MQHPFASIQQSIFSLLEMGRADHAERSVDIWAMSGLEELAESWQMPEPAALHALSALYNNIGQHHLRASVDAITRDGDKDVMKKGIQAGQQCHEKALDLFDIAAEDIVYLPSNSPFNKNFIFTLWGLGISSYFLEQFHTSRKYLILCLRLSPEDEQAATWQSDASNYLHKLEKRPVQIVVQVATIAVRAEQPDIWHVRGNVVGWDSYARPMLEGYKVQVELEDIFRLQALGYASARDLQGHHLTLQTDSTCDLFRPMQIVSVY